MDVEWWWASVGSSLVSLYHPGGGSWSWGTFCTWGRDLVCFILPCLKDVFLSYLCALESSTQKLSKKKKNQKTEPVEESFTSLRVEHEFWSQTALGKDSCLYGSQPRASVTAVPQGLLMLSRYDLVLSLSGWGQRTHWVLTPRQPLC